MGEGTVLICGHGFHWDCYGRMEYSCRHCEEYYKTGINKNVSSFLQRLEKGADTFTESDGFEESQELEEVEEREEGAQEKEIVIDLQNAL